MKRTKFISPKDASMLALIITSAHGKFPYPDDLPWEANRDVKRAELERVGRATYRKHLRCKCAKLGRLT